MSKTAVVYCLITVLAWGVASVFDKVLVGERGLSPWTAVFLRMLVGTAIISGYALCTGALGEVRVMLALDRPMFWTLVGVLIGSALLGSFIGQVAYYHALNHADASRVIPITSTYPLVGALLAIAFLREPLTVHKVAGALLIVAGIILLSGTLNQHGA